LASASRGAFAPGKLPDQERPSNRFIGPATFPGGEVLNQSRGVFRLAGRYTHQLLRFDLGLLVGMTSRDPSFGVSAGATYVFGK